jgi:sortase A
VEKSGARKPFYLQPLSLLSVAFILIGALLFFQGESEKNAQNSTFESSQSAMKEALDVFQNGENETGSGTDVKKLLGLLEAPSIGLSVMMVNYQAYSDLETAVGRMQNSAPFGSSGSTVVVGHRTGFGQPFFDLDRLRVGAAISVTLKDTTILNYVVREQKIVSPDADLSEFDISDATSQLILVTCTPKYSTKDRLLIIADLSDDATGSA